MPLTRLQLCRGSSTFAASANDVYGIETSSRIVFNAAPKTGALTMWREALRFFTLNGRKDGFSSVYKTHGSGTLAEQIMARLSGTWTLTAIAKLAAWDQCVVITGSTNADGAHPMVAGTVITNVRGIDFEVKSQAFNPVMGQWLDSFQIEVMSWDPVKGVMLTISADDKPTPPRPTSTIWSSSAPQPIQSLRRRGSKGRAWT